MKKFKKFMKSFKKKIKKIKLSVNDKIIVAIYFVIAIMFITGTCYIVYENHELNERVAKYSLDNEYKVNYEDSEYEEYKYEFIEELAYEDINSFLKDHQGTLLFISKESCTTCLRIKVEVNEAAKELGIKAYMIDVDSLKQDHKDTLGSKFNLKSVPTLIISELQKGKVSTVGFKTSSEIVEWYTENR